MSRPQAPQLQIDTDWHLKGRINTDWHLKSRINTDWHLKSRINSEPSKTDFPLLAIPRCSKTWNVNQRQRTPSSPIASSLAFAANVALTLTSTGASPSETPSRSSSFKSQDNGNASTSTRIEKRTIYVTKLDGYASIKVIEDVLRNKLGPEITTVNGKSYRNWKVEEHDGCMRVLAYEKLDQTVKREVYRRTCDNWSDDDMNA
ncbi:hypothetical protein BDZ91DRAFT_765789 [Kalaharituber pfeilii]|nr:hypothetical protein BDZ91DRAFT_765789 [Kalaharituber pfeilii]